jgi:hypothetical protein
MPDFHDILRQHLSNAKLPPDVEEELVAHLAEVYEAEINCGSTEQHALLAVRHQLEHPTHLIRAVHRYKGGSLRVFLRRVLVPGLFATVLTTLAGNMLSAFRIQHNFASAMFLTRPNVWFFGPATQWGRAGFVNLDVLLLFSYILAGTLAACLSVRLGGDRRQRLWAALVPSVAPVVLLGVSLVAELTFALVPNHGVPPTSVLLWTLVGYLVGWTVLPAIALLAGAAPFLIRGEKYELARP